MVEFISQYVGLGDSISSDDYPGIGRGAASLVGKYLQLENPHIAVVNLTENGLTSRSLIESLDKLPGDIGGNTLVTITAGGNDIVVNILGGNPNELENGIENVVKNIESAIEKLRETYMSPTIIIGTIYDPTNGNGDFIEGIEMPHAVEIINKMNDRIRQIGEEKGVKVADIHKHFLEGSGPYYSEDSWYIETIEPSSEGAVQIKELFLGELDGS